MTMPQSDPQALLADFRASIDNIDAALIHMLAERFRITEESARAINVAGLAASAASWARCAHIP